MYVRRETGVSWEKTGERRKLFVVSRLDEERRRLMEEKMKKMLFFK